MSTGTPENFTQRTRRALSDGQLQRALATATARHHESRSRSLPLLGSEWERLRERAREVKNHTLAHLDYYLAQFAANVERAGGRVFWAADAAAANRYVVEVARRRGARLAVKSKSMMTEEVELNRALELAGVLAVETDLGEYIVQLAGERPSHITAPAIHKSRHEIAKLFSEKLGAECGPETERITALARRVLRERFARADLGVTGVNFAVAETGTIALIENEGNIRLSTSLPRVHVALMGIEKVVPRMEDLEVFLKVLPLGASGQKITSYVSLLTGLKHSPQDEGPEEFHVVIIDNGRTRALANAELRESLNCIRCGACLNACPVYQKIGGHAYGWIYPGPIGAVLTPQLTGRRQSADLPFASTLCGACRDACPVKIDLPRMLLHLRHEIKEGGPDDARGAPAVGAPAHTQASGGGLGARAAAALEGLAFRLWAGAMKNASRYRRVSRAARWAQKIFGRLGGGTGALPVPPWTRRRDLKPLPPRTFREQWEESRK
ncbi:MAG TPA: LutB/LldF family L-lactate oxidation iron-sulfur protein [Pyrinomonadaceae bacterium]|jgi:L-lactate dehydrogenase complex protein LldF